MRQIIIDDYSHNIIVERHNKEEVMLTLQERDHNQIVYAMTVRDARIIAEALLAVADEHEYTMDKDKEDDRNTSV